MDNVNTDGLIENANENDWVLINKITHQVKDTETVQLPKMQKDLANQTDPNIQIPKNGIEVIHEYIDSDSTSNDVSVITESDTDNPYQNFFTTRQDDNIHVRGPKDMVSRINHHNMHRSKNMVDQIILRQWEFNAKTHILHVIIWFVLGCMIGILFGPSLTTDKNLYRNGIKDLQTEYHSIINTFKEINTTLNEIKAHILIEDKLNKDHVWQLLQNINYSNKKNDRSTKESFNNDPYVLDNLQLSLKVLSLLSNAIYDSNSLLKSDINKTLDIINNTKILYKTLMSFNNNNTQNMNVSTTAAQFLRNAIGKIHHTSHSLLTDLMKKINNIMLNIHNKYSKMKHKLNEKLCHLKNMLPDDTEFLKQLTIRSHSLSNYYEYCHSKSTRRKEGNGKTNREQNIRTNDVKRQTKKIDESMLHTKFKKKDIETIDSETCRDKVIDGCSQSTKIVSQCIDETLNNNFDKTISKQNTKATLDYGNITADKTKVNGPKTNNHFKSNGSTKKISNADKLIEKKNASPQIKMRKSGESYYKSSFKNDPTEQDHHQTKSADWLFERSNEREKLRQASNMHFSEASKSEVEINTSIHDMMRRFGQNIDKIMHLFEQKMEQVLRKHIFSKNK